MENLQQLSLVTWCQFINPFLTCDEVLSNKHCLTVLKLHSDTYRKPRWLIVYLFLFPSGNIPVLLHSLSHCWFVTAAAPPGHSVFHAIHFHFDFWFSSLHSVFMFPSLSSWGLCSLCFQLMGFSCPVASQVGSEPSLTALTCQQLLCALWGFQHGSLAHPGY